MRVIMFKNQFKNKILAGDKTSTIRKNARCKPGDILSLRCWTGKPYRSKHDAFAWALCSAATSITITEGEIIMSGIPVKKDMREAMARKDGFGCFLDMYNFFKETHGLPFSGYLIQWGQSVQMTAMEP